MKVYSGIDNLPTGRASDVEDESYISNQVKIRFSFGDYSDVIEDTLNNAIAY